MAYLHVARLLVVALGVTGLSGCSQPPEPAPPTPAAATPVLVADPAVVAAAEARVAAVLADTRFETAMAAIARDHDRLVEEIVALTEIPAPPFTEQRRAAAYLERLRAAGLADVEQDNEGNVMGLRRGTAPTRGVLAIVAHLDTVFPENTDVRVTRDGTRLMAPGIGDNTRSLAVLLAIIRAMHEAGIETAHDILFVGNVGEEGRGDLRGVRYLLQQGKYKDRITQVIAVDGSGDGSSVVNGGVASRRFRVVFTGPGGHSYGAFGLVSPAFAMGAAMQKFGRLHAPASPRTTFGVGVVGGGTSVNSIPFETWMDIDMRSESPAELARLEADFRRVVQEAVDEENAARSTRNGPVAADLRLIGDRPGGQTPVDAPIVQIAAASARAHGLDPRFGFSSTDANLPISLGIPAVRLASGGSGGDAHALTEWIDVEPAASLRGIRVLLATILSLARE